MVLVIKRKLLISIFVIIILCALCIPAFFFVTDLFTVQTDTLPKGYAAIIIDDFGNNGDGTEEMFNLHIPITAAVMPFLPFSTADAVSAHQAGLEVILHIPMEPNFGKKTWLGPKGITTDLTDEEVRSRIAEGLEQIKWASGMNNHMGSKATQDERIMKIILGIAKEHNLYYVDSKTTPNSVIGNLAQEIDLHHFDRHIFLDNIKNQQHVEKQLEKLGEIALEKGYAIGIGHVGPEGGSITARAIKKMIPILEQKGVQFVYVSQLKEIKAHLEQE
ncbi:MAG: divergent polysaccharide deacetylase family protein [Bacillota bacterium]